VTESEYLLANGWLPSPSSHASGEGAWEHPMLSRIPEAWGLNQQVYDPNLARWGKATAMAIQVVEERRWQDVGLFP
jgi:hypothetical protein